MTDPEIAVVIPTRNRETRLAFALEALASQSLPRERFEVIVVRAPDASPPLASAPDGLEVRFLTAPGPAGAAAQRNFGWRAARAPLVAFTDDDCRPAPEWLEAIRESANGEGIVQGRTEPDPDERHLLHGNARSMEVTEPSEWYPTCNIAYPRALLEGLGGFDEGFPGAWCEDTDLGLRAREEGVGVRYADRALVWHAVLPRPLPVRLREVARRDTVPLLARHPEQRKALYLGFFLRPTHARLLLALAGLLLFGRRRPLVAFGLAVPYLEQRINWEAQTARRLPRRLARIPFHLLGRVVTDLVEIAVTVRSAIRHRVPVV